jgi:hypothetical protein
LIVTEGVSAVSRGGVITFYPDVWVLDHANGRGGPPAWTLLPTSNHPSIGREFFAYGYHPASNRLVVGLGLSDTQPELQQDAWVLTNASGQCTAHQPCTYDVEATDPDGDPLTFSLDAAPAGMTIDAATGLLTWTPTPAQIGNHTVTVRVHDNGGGAAIQTFTLTVAPVAVPNVVGLDPVSAEALIGAADLSVGAITQAGGAITLRFDTLPSAQGWSYVSDGAAEASIFSVSGSALTQDTDDFAGAATIQHYQRSAVSPSLPFSISVRARVLADSTTGFGQPNAFGFCFSGCTGAECFAIGLDTGRIQAVTGAVLSTTIDNTQFHDYRLVATPGVGFELYVDHVLLATGPPRVEASNASLLLWGLHERARRSCRGDCLLLHAAAPCDQPASVSRHTGCEPVSGRPDGG